MAVASTPLALREPQPATAGTRSPSFDALRIISALGVVLIHVSAPLLTTYASRGPRSWWIGNLYDSAVRWCVPVFVMLSGAFLLGRSEPLGRFWKKRGRKVLVPFVAWSLFYAWWAAAKRDGEPDWLRFLMQPTYYHLWFFYMILGLYVLAPAIDALLRAADAHLLAYLVGVWFVWASVLPTLEAQLDFDTRLGPERYNVPLQFAGYFILGWLLSRPLLTNERERLLAVVALAVGFIATVLGTHHATVVAGDGRFDGVYYEYHSANVMLMSLGIFVLMRGLPSSLALWRGRAARRLLASAGNAVLGVYLVHPVVLDLVRKGRLGIALEVTSFHPALAVPLLALVVFSITLAAVLVLRRIPLVRELVP